MKYIGRQCGLEVFYDPDGTYYVRVPVDDGGFGSVHDLYKRVPIGKYASYTEACKAIARRTGGSSQPAGSVPPVAPSRTSVHLGVS